MRSEARSGLDRSWLCRALGICRFTLALSLLATAGCSPARLVNFLTPRDDFRLVADLPYGTDPRQRLDLYQPIGPARGTVVFLYGGNWDSGTKADYLFVGEALAARGFAAVIPDYRLYPAVRYPAFLEDAAAAFRWTQSQREVAGPLFLMGHSAGAYIAAMLALDGRWLGPERRAVAGTVGLAGPYDFLPLADPELQDIFGSEGDLMRTQPITFADGSAAPMLLISGLADHTVRPENSMRLAARIRRQGGQAVERYYEGTGHVELIGSLARPLRFLAPTEADIADFLGRHAMTNGAAER